MADLNGQYVSIQIKGDLSGWEATPRTVVRDLDSIQSSAKQTTSAVDQLKGALAGLAGVAALTALVKSSLDAALQVERLQKMFTAASGSAALAAKEMEYVKGVVNRMGLDLVTTAESYGKFLAAIRGTTLEGEKGRKVFESVSNASAALGLRADETSGIFNALQQMMSKGKVQAEELRGQLGERLPGAFKLAADAMGMTTAELDKALKDGKVLAGDLLPKLAEQLDKKFGKAALSGANHLNEMNNAIFATKAALGTELLPAMTMVIQNAILPMINLVGTLIKSWQTAAAVAAYVFQQTASGTKDIMTGKVFTRDGYAASMADAMENEKIFKSQLDKIWTAPDPKSANYSAADLARQAQNKATKPIGDDKAAAKAAKEAATWATTIATLRKEIDALQPGLDRHDKAILDTTLKYDELIKKYPKHKAELQSTMTAHLSAIEVQRQYNQAVADSKKEMDDLKAATEAQAAAEKAYWQEIANTAKAVEALQPGAAVSALDKQIDDIYTMAEKLPDMAEKATTAIEALLKFKELDQEIEDLNNNLIEDPYARQLAQIESFYTRKFELIDQERDALLDLQEQNSNNFEKWMAYQQKIEKLDDKHAALRKNQIQDSEKVQKDSLRSQASMISQHIGLAGQMFQTLADVQDTSSRDGFEASKSFNTAAAIMNTAAAITNALATSGNIYTGIAMAAVAAASGAAQISAIQSTTFGGGGAAPTVSAGSFQGGSAMNGGTVGGSIGNRITSVQDSATVDSLQALVDPLENASLAIGRAADGLTAIADLFEDGSMLSKLTGSLVSPAGAGDQSQSFIGSFFKTVPTSLVTAIGGLPFLSDNWLKQVDTMFRAAGDMMFGGKEFQTGQGYVIRAIDGIISTLNYVTSQTPGGWFNSTKNSIGFAANPTMDAAIQPYISSIVATISRAVVGLGTTVDSTKLSSPGGVVVTMGATPEMIADQMEAVLTTISNDMAKAVVGLEQYAYYGEDAFAALVRLITSLQGVNEELELIGATLIDASLAGGNAAYRLMDMMGGAEAFAESVDNYFTTMFSDTEQQAQLAAQAWRQVDVAFAEMGESVPATRAEFRDLVNGLDLTTDRGAALFGALMNVSESFGTVMDAADETAERLKSLRDATADLTVRGMQAAGVEGADLYAMDLAAIREIQQAAADGMSGAYIDQLTQVLSLEREAASITAEYELQVEALNVQLTEANKTVSTLTGYVNKLASARKSMQLQDAAYQQAQYAAAQAVLASVLVAARGGDLSGIATMDDQLQILTKQGADAYANSTDYKRDFWQTSNSISELERLAGNQLTDAQQQVALLQQQADILKQNNDSQLSALYSINTSVLSLADALGGYQTAAAAAKAQVVASDPIEKLYSSVLGRTSDASGYDYWSTQYSAGMSLSEITARFYDSAEYQSLPKFAVGGITSGISIAGEAGPEAVIPLPDGRRVPVQLSGTADNATLQEIKSLLQELLQTNRSAGSETVKTAKKLVEYVEDWDVNGMPGVRTA